VYQSFPPRADLPKHDSSENSPVKGGKISPEGLSYDENNKNSY
jgi:hypothetical protein